MAVEVKVEDGKVLCDRGCTQMCDASIRIAQSQQAGVGTGEGQQPTQEALDKVIEDEKTSAGDDNCPRY